jgi:acyl-CoA thioester hydrolase
MEHKCPVSVRSYECDSYGHVNNAVYLNYLEYARHQFLKDISLSIDEMRAAGHAVWVAEIRIKYIKPAVTDDRLEIFTAPLKKSGLSGVLGQRILRGADTIAEAEVKWVSVDTQGRPTPLPERFQREGLQPC